MKIKLILSASKYEPMYRHNPFMPLVLPLLAACAPDHEYTLIDMLSGDTIDFDEPVDLVGLSIRSSSEKTAYAIAKEFKKRRKTVVFGGSHVSALPFEAIRHCDAVVIGEGEKLWPIIINDVVINSLKNFYVCCSETFNPQGYSVFQKKTYTDLSIIPTANRHLIRQKYQFDTIFSSRGCPIDCDFCSVTGLFGAKTRFRPVEHVVSEIQTLKKYFYLIDDSVFGKPDTFEYYLKLYKELKKLPKKRFWLGQANLDAVSSKRGREVIKNAQQAGLVYVAIGIESINPTVLERSGSLKKMGMYSTKDVKKVIQDHIQFIQDLGIMVSGWFAVGYEEDTMETYYRNYEFCCTNNILPAIFPVKATPGSRLYKQMRKENKLTNSKLFNLHHPLIEDKKISKALDYIIKNGYSHKSFLKRILFYLPRFKKDIIFKTIFFYILHQRLKKGVDCNIICNNREHTGL